MQTTLDLDDDVANLLDAEVHRSGQPLEQTVNRLLRSGLAQQPDVIEPKPFKVVGARHVNVPPEWLPGYGEQCEEVVPAAELPAFVVKPIHAELPVEWTSGSVQEPLNLLDAAEA